MAVKKPCPLRVVTRALVIPVKTAVGASSSDALYPLQRKGVSQRKLGLSQRGVIGRTRHGENRRPRLSGVSEGGK